jgi:hypothetical protein
VVAASDLSQTLLASGIDAAVVGAILSAVLSLLFLLWQMRRSVAAARAAARVIHLEIAFNINMLATGARSSPAQFMVSHRAWDAKFPDVQGVLNEHEVVEVAAPYLQLDALESIYFAEGQTTCGSHALCGGINDRCSS